MKRTHTILATITLISVILTSACTAGSANSSATSSAPETAVTTTTAPAVTGTVIDRIDEPKAETTTAQTTAITAVTTAKPQETKKAETTTTTTKAVTTAKPKPATTTTAATTKPAPEWTESKASGTKYVNTDCYSRKKAVLGAETVKLYSVNDKVTVTAKTNTGYYKLSDGSFIHSDYLSDSKVNVQIATTTTTQKTEIPNITDTFYSSHSYGSKQYLIDLCEYYGFTEYTEKDRNNVDNYTKMIFETYESGSYEKQLKEYISKYLGKHDGRYEIVYDDVYNVYGIQPYTYIPDSEWRFTKQDCEDILKACEKYAKDNGYSYCKPSDFDTVKGKVYQHSSWSQVFANKPEAPKLRWSGYTCKEKMIGILCEEIQLNYEEGLGATCVDYCLASEYCQWAKEHWGIDISNDTACQDLTAYVFFPCY